MEKLCYLLVAAILMIGCTAKGSKAPEEDNSFTEEYESMEDSIKQVVDEHLSKIPQDSSNKAKHINYLTTSKDDLEGNPAPR